MQGTPSTPHKSEQKTEEQKLTPTRSTRSATRASKEEQVLTPEKTTTDASVKAKITEIVQQQRENEEKYGDLIEFYNLVYVKELKDFALKFAQTRSVCTLTVVSLRDATLTISCNLQQSIPTCCCKKAFYCHCVKVVFLLAALRLMSRVCLSYCHDTSVLVEMLFNVL